MTKVYDGRSDVDLIFSGRLEKLEEVDYDGAVRVEVALSAQMTELRSGKTLSVDAASEVAEVDKRTVPAVVADFGSGGKYHGRADVRIIDQCAVRHSDSARRARGTILT
jgi:hypothetical protein